LQGRGMRERLQQQAEAARRAFGFYESLKALHDGQLPGPLDRYPETALTEESADATKRELRRAYNQSLDEMGTEGGGELKAWPARADQPALPLSCGRPCRGKTVDGFRLDDSVR